MKTNIVKEQPKVTYSVALVLAFLSAENENQQLEDLPLANFCRWKISSVGKDKVYQWEFCKLKFTTIVVFVINIQRIFPSQELAPTHSTIVIQGLSIHLFSFIHKSAFLFSKGLLCLYYKQNNRRLLVDMEFFFSCSLVSYRVKHSKRNSISMRAHVLFSISQSSFLMYFINNSV